MAKNSTTALELDNPFWHFALKLYQQDGVEAACLALQQQGCSINRLLFCLWLTKESKQWLNCPVAEQWQQQMTVPLRAIRFQLRQLKTEQAELTPCYQQLRKSELAMEQVEIAYLYRAGVNAPKVSSDKQLICANLDSYLKTINKERTALSVNLQPLLDNLTINSSR